jgi:hypothetical protein
MSEYPELVHQLWERYVENEWHISVLNSEVYKKTRSAIPNVSVVPDIDGLVKLIFELSGENQQIRVRLKELDIPKQLKQHNRP